MNSTSMNTLVLSRAQTTALHRIRACGGSVVRSPTGRWTCGDGQQFSARTVYALERVQLVTLTWIGKAARGSLTAAGIAATDPVTPAVGPAGELRAAGRHADGCDYAVASVVGPGSSAYRREPCGGCPWRRDAVGTFPAEAFRLSARTAFDLSSHVFACHESGSARPALCAGFLLRGAQHNLAVRLRRQEIAGVTDGGQPLFDSYREMAIANGVPPDDPEIAACR